MCVCVMLISVVRRGSCAVFVFRISLHFIFCYSNMTKVIWTKIGTAASIYTDIQLYLTTLYIFFLYFVGNSSLFYCRKRTLSTHSFSRLTKRTKTTFKIEY